MAFDYLIFKRTVRIFLVVLTLGMVASPALAAPLSPLQYQSARGSGSADGFSGENPCDQRPGRRHSQGQGDGTICDTPPKYSAHGNESSRRPGSNAFGLQFDTEGY